MPRRSWKHVRAGSLRQALELSLEHARERHNRSVERVADRMGLASHWTLFKWASNGRIPAVLIPAFEAACGLHLITAYLAGSAGKLLIDVPAGRRASARDINALQASMTDAVGALLRFADGKAEAEETIAALTDTLESLAWHRGNVERAREPELDLAGGDHG